jgi:hypothetical protein
MGGPLFHGAIYVAFMKIHSTQIMNARRLLPLSAGALLALTGCNHASSDMPADGFRLTVQDIATDTDMRVAQLVIHSSAPATITTDADSSHPSVPIPASASGEGSVSLVASRVAPYGQPWAYFHTLIRVQTIDGLAGGPTMEALPIATELSNYFTVTAKSGDYSFDTPIEIGTMRGKPVTITLKRGAK